MTLIIADRIKETSTSTGTGDFTLAGAVPGYRAFSAVCASPTDTCYYTIQAVDANGVPTGEWEVGLGTYSAASILTRTTVLSSSTGAAVSFAAGAKQVWIDLAAAQVASISPKRTILKRAANQSVTNNSSDLISWDTSVEDSVGAWSAGTPTIITVPSGYTKVRVSDYVTWSSNSASNLWNLIIINAVQCAGDQRSGNYESSNCAITGFVTVSGGQTLSVTVRQSSGGTLTLTGSILCEWL